MILTCEGSGSWSEICSEKYCKEMFYDVFIAKVGHREKEHRNAEQYNAGPSNMGAIVCSCS